MIIADDHNEGCAHFLLLSQRHFAPAPVRRTKTGLIRGQRRQVMMTIEKFEATRANRRLWKFVLGLGVAGALVVPAVTAQATTYTNVVTGAPGSGKCNLSDAIKAASTNTAVHSCPAGSSSTTD